MLFRSTLEETLDAITSGRSNPEELIKSGDKILGWNAMDITCKLRPDDADVAALGPDFQQAWNQDFKNSPNRPLLLIALLSWYDRNHQ